MKKIIKKVSPVKPAAAPKAATTTKPVPAPAPVPAATKAPAKKTIAPAKKKTAGAKTLPATFITARIDIGFGNQLFIRGEGPGLSWDSGLAMDCVGTGLWSTSVPDATSEVVFKVLVNDLTWNSGSDFVASPGQSLTIEPSF